MAEALERRGNDVHVVTYPLADEETPVSYRVERVAGDDMRLNPAPGPSLRKILLDLRLYRCVKRLLETTPFDIVHAHHYEGLIVSLCARARARADLGRIPIVYDSHTLLASELPYYYPRPVRGPAGFIGITLDRGLPHRADHIIVVTESMRRWLSASGGVDVDRLTLIANGVEHEHFGRTPSQERSERNSAPRIAYAGNLAEYQGIDLLLGAFKKLRSAIRGAQLLIITDSDSGRQGRRITDLGLADSVSVVHSDFMTLPQHLAEADVLVNPRIQCEGIPQKLLNYMAAARPIVSFAGSAALLEHERTALIVPDGDTNALADAALRVIRDPELGIAMGQEARRQVISQHGWDQVAARVESVYEDVLGARR